MKLLVLGLLYIGLLWIDFVFCHNHLFCKSTSRYLTFSSLGRWILRTTAHFVELLLIELGFLDFVLVFCHQCNI